MKTQINSELLLASVNSVTGDILYTMKFTLPKYLIGELNTHRVFSRNSASSRAIPNKRMRLNVWNDPFVPTKIGEAKQGMAPGAELRGLRRSITSLVWKGARVPAILAASILDLLGVHKALSNRLLEPWMWTTVIVTATDWDNFFNLRAHEAAEPHIAELAYQAKSQVRYVEGVVACIGHEPKWRSCYVEPFRGIKIQLLQPGEWHLPFVSNQELFSFDSLYDHRKDNRVIKAMYLETAKKVSAARCARVSYNLPDTGKPSSVADDLKLYERLAGSDPKHLSPVEHQAEPMLRSEYSANFRGWKQFRREIEEAA